MVEVFKTNVTESEHAKMLTDQIHTQFKNCKANFDLEDCDKILRVKCLIGKAPTWQLVQLLTGFGFKAEILSDETNSEIALTEKQLIGNRIIKK